MSLNSTTTCLFWAYFFLHLHFFCLLPPIRVLFSLRFRCDSPPFSILSFSGECLSRMDQLDGIPERVLGLRVKSRWQIVLHYLLPSVMELIVYVSLSTIDIGVAYRHWTDRHRLYALITLALILVPALLTFVCVMLSDQWPLTEEGGGCCGSKSHWHFFALQLVNLVCFPIAAIYR